MSTDDSFVAFVSARSARLVAYAELLCGDRERARDLVQSVLTRAYPRWDRIEQDDPYGYLCRAVTNAVTDWWRRAHRRRERLVETLPENSSIVDETSGLDDRRPGGRGAQQSDHADPVRRSVQLPPPHPHADRNEQTTIAGEPVLIDVLGPEQQFSWVRTGNLYVLSATDHSEADLRELVAFVMEWYQRKR